MSDVLRLASRRIDRYLRRTGRSLEDLASRIGMRPEALRLVHERHGRGLVYAQSALTDVTHLAEREGVIVVDVPNEAQDERTRLRDEANALRHARGWSVSQLASALSEALDEPIDERALSKQLAPSGRPSEAMAGVLRRGLDCLTAAAEAEASKSAPEAEASRTAIEATAADQEHGDVAPEPDDDAQALIDRIDAVRARLGETWPRMAALAGERGSYFKDIRRRLARGARVDLDRLNAALNLLDAEIVRREREAITKQGDLTQVFGIDLVELREVLPAVRKLLAARQLGLDVSLRIHGGEISL